MSGARATADVLLTISSDVSELRKTQEEFVRARGSALEFAKVGTAFAAANQAISGALAGIKAALKGTLVQGVQFNAQLEQAQIGVASVLKQFNPDQYKTFNSAIEASTGVIAELRKQAVETPATFNELLEGFQSTAGAMAAANIPLDKQVKLIVMASQAMTTLGINTQELRQEVTALMMGNIDRNARLAKTLGIESADIAKAKAAGNLYEFLAGKMAAFSEGAKLAAQNITVLQSNLEDATTLQAADSTKELTEAYRGLLRALTDLVKSNSFKEILEMASNTAAVAVDAVAGSARIVASNPNLAAGLAAGLTSSVGAGMIIAAVPKLATMLTPSFQGLGTTLGQALAVGFASAMIQSAIYGFGQALDAMLKEEQQRLQTYRDTLDSLKEAGTAAEVEASIRRTTVQLNAAKQELADWKERPSIWQGTAYGQQELERITSEIAQYQRLIDLAKAHGDEIAKQNKLLAKQREEVSKIAQANENRAKATEKALEGDAYAKAVQANRKALFSAMSPAQQAADLRKQIEGARAALLISPKASDLAKLDASGNPTAPTQANEQAAETMRLQASTRLLELESQLKKIEEQITREKDKQAKSIAAASEKKLKSTLDAQEVALQQQLNLISDRRAAIEASNALTTGEKRKASIELIRQERAELEKFIATLMAEKAAASSSTEKQLIQRRIDETYARLNENQKDQSRTAAGPARGLEKFNTQLRQMAEDADATFNVLDAGFTGLQSGIMDALTTARNFGDGFKKVLSSLGLGIANAIMQIISLKIAMGIFTLGAGLFSGGTGAVTGASAGAAASAAVQGGGSLAAAYSAAGGGTFLTNGRTNFTVGDNPGGVELVHVVPLSGRGQTRLNGRSLAMAGGGTALINSARFAPPQRVSLPQFSVKNGEGGSRENVSFHYTFQTGVTRQEVAALIPLIEQRTIQKMDELQRRRRN